MVRKNVNIFSPKKTQNWSQNRSLIHHQIWSFTKKLTKKLTDNVTKFGEATKIVTEIITDFGETPKLSLKFSLNTSLNSVTHQIR